MMRPVFSVDDLLRRSAERRPFHVAVVDGRERLSFTELDRRVEVLSRRLVEDGLSRGDRVAIWLERSSDAIASMLAVARAGGVFVNVSPVLKSQQVTHIIEDSGARRLIGAPEVLSQADLPHVETTYVTGAGAVPLSFSTQVRALRPMIDGLNENGSSGASKPASQKAIESDLATILYTSGSTGMPKGIMFSHKNLVSGAAIVSTYLENTGADRILALLPFSFDYGLSQVTTMLRVAGTVVIQRSLLPGDILNALRRERVTGLAMVPPLWPVVLQNRRSLLVEPPTHLRYVSNSGGTVAEAHLAELRRLMPATSIYLMYGLTEAFRSTYLPPQEVDRGPSCIGRAIPGTDVFVVDDDGNEVSPGGVGELVHRGPTVAMGYWGDPERTARAYRRNPFAQPEIGEAEKVVYSGDLVRKGDDGYLYFVGRRDAQIKTHGYRVSPEEAEALLQAVPGVREAIVFPEPDPAIGERIVAVVTTWDGVLLSADSIKAAVKKQAPHYLVPARVHFAESLPKGATGKINREGLKATYGLVQSSVGGEESSGTA